MKRSISFLLAAALVVCLFSGLTVTAAAWDGSAADAFDGGSGSQNDPYLISTAAQLALFRDEVNDGRTSICAKVVGNIDLEFVEWTPIGLTSTGYTGVFDGGGWQIANVNVDSISNTIKVIQSGSTKKYSVQVGGLFGVLGEGGAVKYVNISGRVSGDIYSRNSTGVYIGALVGCALGTVEESYSTCTISDLSINNNNFIGVGGLVGCAYQGAVIKNSYNIGDIDITTFVSKSSHNNYIGGLVGLADCQVLNCYCATPITVSTNSSDLYLGGLFGNSGGELALENCWFNADVSPVAYASGCDYESSTAHNPAGCESRETWYMQSPDFPAVLGNVFEQDKNWVNEGYPVLIVMNYDEEEAESGWFYDEINKDEETKNAYETLFPADLESKDLRKPVTRVEFCAVAVRLYEQMGGAVLEASELNNPFEDTSNDAVVKAYTIGITDGVSETSFDPYVNISRQDLATMLTRVYKALNLPGWTLATDGSFTLDYSDVALFSDDGSIDAYAKPSVYFMVKYHIIDGVAEGVFAPKNVTSAQAAIGYADATREQAVIMAVRAFINLG